MIQKFTIDDLEAEIWAINDSLKKIRAAKGHDYSNGTDTFENLRSFGSLGVAVRIGDKFHRIKNYYLHKELAVKDETIKDTMFDLINYSFYLPIMWRQEQEESK